jgi:hypothetical protein
MVLTGTRGSAQDLGCDCSRVHSPAATIDARRPMVVARSRKLRNFWNSFILQKSYQKWIRITLTMVPRQNDFLPNGHSFKAHVMAFFD